MSLGAGGLPFTFPLCLTGRKRAQGEDKRQSSFAKASEDEESIKTKVESRNEVKTLTEASGSKVKPKYSTISKLSH
jgi:hypothetical protein